ncbi:MAG TPA: bifunctional demethylmenaquinone methyltransferase/2-methoxy-6-polyprenyl-1,4-benzoquinol methylase [Gammaproteobacteria bacterium]|nr:bifunctional demethylmenaquinone methyltransferase/2-methoxy-6-polyprenyl-1,4-benzoquinol methylase [Gammaproteobacteria bacterium]|tara:strand:+ start:1947 stop:2735 length:789 start_codon:yes stop_codon:yes gene_type:complete
MTEKTTHFGFREIPIGDKANKVANVFRSVASQYDIMNDLMSLGTHRLMKAAALEYTGARKGQKILDLAGGTGDFATKLSPVVGNDGHIVLCDINDAMLDQGRDRLLDSGITQNITFVQADAEHLPFPVDTFSAITIGFGLRNFTDKQAALASCREVLKPGGRLVILEFSTPVNPVVKKLYDGYSGLWPRLGKAVTGDSDSYQYLVESIKMHPSQEELSTMMTDAGYQRVNCHNLLNGVAAIHVGKKEVGRKDVERKGQKKGN